MIKGLSLIVTALCFLGSAFVPLVVQQDFMGKVSVFIFGLFLLYLTYRIVAEKSVGGRDINSWAGVATIVLFLSTLGFGILYVAWLFIPNVCQYIAYWPLLIAGINLLLITKGTRLGNKRMWVKS